MAATDAALQSRREMKKPMPKTNNIVKGSQTGKNKPPDKNFIVRGGTTKAKRNAITTHCERWIELATKTV
jgi:hypothetical protein